ncbi:MAG: AAA family ATPase [Candidatus Latescibacteria bacterium]|nr:AAA family ATPase [Candidatus Latescibacterota bacterium]
MRKDNGRLIHPDASMAESDTLIAARAYHKRGYLSVPSLKGAKGPTLTGWPDLRLTETELPQYYGHGGNIGLLLGVPESELGDIDCDVPEAINAAPWFLPPTDMIHGRPGKPRSHWWYQVPSGLVTIQFRDIDGTMLVELRGLSQQKTPMQTLVPPSEHPSGERYTWDAKGHPARVDAAILLNALEHMAACVLLARHWPSPGSRDVCAMALAGALKQAGWSEPDITWFIRTVAEIAGDEEAEKRAEQGFHTPQRMAQGIPVTGLPTFAELVGGDVVAKVAAWLHLTPSDDGLPITITSATADGLAPVFVRPPVWTADELLEAPFPEPLWIVPGLLPVGLTILAGRPKVGKSWMMLQLAQAVGAGGKFLDVDVPPGAAWYFALEDHPQRLQKRMHDQHWEPGLPVRFGTELFRTHDDPYGLQYLTQLIHDQRPRLLIVDTLSRMFPGVEQNDVGIVTQVLTPLQRVALEKGCAIVIVDHKRKGVAKDVVDDPLGSTGKTAVADVVWGLNRERKTGAATLEITGRDVLECELALAFDPRLCCWFSLGDARTVQTTEAQQAVLEALSTLDGRATPTQLAQILKDSNGPSSLHDSSNVTKVLQELIERKEVEREEKKGREVYYHLLTCEMADEASDAACVPGDSWCDVDRGDSCTDEAITQ